MKTATRGTERTTSSLTTGKSCSLVFISLPNAIRSAKMFHAVIGVSCILAPAAPSLVVVRDALTFSAAMLSCIEGAGSIPLGSVVFF